MQQKVVQNERKCPLVCVRMACVLACVLACVCDLVCACLGVCVWRVCLSAMLNDVNNYLRQAHFMCEVRGSSR